MQIKPIKTERDHRQALREIAQLMEARPGTPWFKMVLSGVQGRAVLSWD